MAAVKSCISYIVTGCSRRNKARNEVVSFQERGNSSRRKVSLVRSPMKCANGNLKYGDAVTLSDGEERLTSGQPMSVPPTSSPRNKNRKVRRRRVRLKGRRQGDSCTRTVRLSRGVAERHRESLDSPSSCSINGRDTVDRKY